MTGPCSDADAAVRRAFRSEYGRTVAVLVRMLGGDLAAAEDAVQEAFGAAAATWPQRGVPPNPQAWVLTVARRKAIDRLRQEDTARTAAARATTTAVTPSPEPLADDELTLLFLCCHPALSTQSQVVLTLKLVGGLTAAEIARALRTPEATIAQRLSRAKAKVRDASISMRLPEPERWTDRAAAVLAVIYLIYNEGYVTTAGDLTQPELCQEATRLAERACRLLPHEPEALGLLALLLLLEARRPARESAEGALITLPDQDRSLWRPDLIATGQRLVRQCLTINRPGPYQIQAAIQAVHADASTPAHTDWQQILTLYDQLTTMLPTPAVATSRAVAVAHVHGPQQALAALDAVHETDQYTLAVRADLLTQLGRHQESRQHYRLAADHTSNRAEREHLLSRAHG